MGNDTSARLALPLLAAGQAQKEMTVNEALTRLDVAVQPSVAAGGTNTPLATPTAGQCWIVGDAPEGDWSGRAGMLAGWTADGWRFVAPNEGMAVWVAAEGTTWRRVDGAWQAGTIAGARVVIDGLQVVGSRAAAIETPDGGAVTDGEARAAVAAILAALRLHGLIAT